MKKLVIAGFGVLMPMLSQASVDPSVVNIKVYETRVSPDATCSSGFIRIFRDPSPVAQNFLTHPVIGSGPIPNGTYRCVALRISDLIGFQPAVDDLPNCSAGSTYTQDIFRGETDTSPDGGSFVTAVGEDIGWIYLSTAGDNNNTGTQPTAPGHLDAPFIVTSDRISAFVVDFRGQVHTSGGSQCSLEGPIFSFR